MAKRMESFAHAVLEPTRRELTAYLRRLVLRGALAEELVQATFLRALESVDAMPAEPQRARAWLFRVATNLAIDELRRHANKRETLLFDLRAAAEADPAFVARSAELIGTPETKSIAREHVAACFSCVLRNLPEQRAACVLLREVFGFSVDESADILGVRADQAKNWLQEGRARMVATYDSTCALVGKQGVCHQCVELDGFMRAHAGSPSGAAPLSFESRIAIVRERASQPWGTWHRMLFELLDELR